jgi:hypothetical protein
MLAADPFFDDRRTQLVNASALTAAGDANAKPQSVLPQPHQRSVRCRYFMTVLGGATVVWPFAVHSRPVATSPIALRQ